MQGSEKFAIRVGAALSVLLIAAVVIVLRVDFSDLGPAVRIRVYLKHPGPLRASADVQLAGRKIGRVDAVHLVTANVAKSPDHMLHPHGGVMLSVLVRKKYLPWVRQNSELFVNSKGLIGESYLEVAPPPADQEMLAPLGAGDAIRGIDPARMEEIIVTSFQNAQRFGALLKELEPSMDQLRGDLEALNATLDALAPSDTQPIGDAVSRTQAEFYTLSETISTASGPGLPSVARLQAQSRRLVSRARGEFTAVSRAVDELTQRMQGVRDRVPDELWTKFDRATREAKTSLARLEATVAKVEDLSERVASGIGTVGALINDKEFADDAKKLGRYIKRHPWEFLTRPLD